MANVPWEESITHLMGAERVSSRIKRDASTAQVRRFQSRAPCSMSESVSGS